MGGGFDSHVAIVMEVSDEVTLIGHVDRQVKNFPSQGNSTCQALTIRMCLVYSRRKRRPV